MKPDHTHGLCSLLIGDCRTRLADIPDNSIHCCVTSPPYWGLRDYGHGNQIGLEATPEAYVEQMAAVFCEVRRVLRDDGTLWLNLGDSYAGSNMTGGNKSINAEGGSDGFKMRRQFARKQDIGTLKAKDLVGIPWRVAFALQADGWYLRQDIIWSKPNPMPESITDRCTKSHEYVFLLAKNDRYFYDADAVKERATGRACGNKAAGKSGAPTQGLEIRNFAAVANKEYYDRNRRSVWHIATRPYSGAHFATFPPALITPCILAGTSAKGCCSKCGAPWERVLENPGQRPRTNNSVGYQYDGNTGHAHHNSRRPNGQQQAEWRAANPVRTTGWQPSCECNADVVPCVVLDPFSGSGTTGIVSRDHGRRYIGCELSPEYAELTKRRWAGLEPEDPEDDAQQYTGPQQGRLFFGVDD